MFKTTKTILFRMIRFEAVATFRKLNFCFLLSVSFVPSLHPFRITFYLYVPELRQLSLVGNALNPSTSEIVPGVISAGVSVPVQIPSQTPDLAGNYWPRLQWSQLFGFPPASLLVGQESPPPPSATPSTVPRPLLASLGIPTQSTQHQAPSTPATTPVHNSDTSEWNDWISVSRKWFLVPRQGAVFPRVRLPTVTDATAKRDATREESSPFR